MFELPEFVTLARQINETLAGKIVRSGALGNSPHKFVWYNRSPRGVRPPDAGQDGSGRRRHAGRWLFVPLEPGYVLLLGECGGRLLYHPPGASCRRSTTCRLAFDDGSALTATTADVGRDGAVRGRAGAGAAVRQGHAAHPGRPGVHLRLLLRA